jgi:prolyl oligopeptidase
MAQIHIAPPITIIEPVTEILHGIEITDPYRWLEDQNSLRTRKWLDEQAVYTRAYFQAIPEREQIRERVAELLALKETISDPWNIGNRYFYSRRHIKGQQPIIVMKDGLFGEERVLVDPAERGTGDSTAVGIVAISDDGRLLAYSVRHCGTDHSALEILDIENRTVLPDGLPNGLCTGFVFAPDDSGFYYSHRELHDPHPNYRASFWHRFGTERSQDQQIFFAGDEPNLFLQLLHSAEARALVYVVLCTGKFHCTSIYLQDLTTEPANPPRLLLPNIESCFAPFFMRGQLLACTNHTAPNFRIVRIDLDDPDPSRWHDVVPESDRRIQQFAVAAGRIFVSRVDHFSTHVEAFGLDGRQSGANLSPTHATVELSNNPTNSSDKLFYSYTSISEPPALHCYDPDDEYTLTLEGSRVEYDPSNIAVEEVEYSSKDGTVIPLFLAVCRDLLHSHLLPTFLTGYGGFGNCVTPRFTAFATFLMEQGFLFAVPALRGGSELGEQWHHNGTGKHRQNSFDDFIAAAEWLVAEERSAPHRIAIGGGSNGALLAGAVITQRPDLFCAAICLGPLLDMTRYQLFDLASGWAYEYGSPEDEQDFRSLLSFSPYHRIRDGAVYPAVLLISGDSDTRCNPMHARKMAARLQAANSSTHPILLDYKPEWGHMPVQPLSKRTEALADRLAFVCHELGVPIHFSKGA